MHSFIFDVLRGLSPMPDEEVLQLYGGTYHVPLQQDSGFYGKVRRILVGNSNMNTTSGVLPLQDLDVCNNFKQQGGESSLTFILYSDMFWMFLLH